MLRIGNRKQYIGLCHFSIFLKEKKMLVKLSQVFSSQESDHHCKKNWASVKKKPGSQAIRLRRQGNCFSSLWCFFSSTFSREIQLLKEIPYFFQAAESRKSRYCIEQVQKGTECIGTICLFAVCCYVNSNTCVFVRKQDGP